ncbi:hypothetical protein NHX12_022511 [Muraenolepis orangiensis]|uniref:Arginine vasopressin-induced protein 1 n=1 Tax=Muraenolepis orangiensis TaxID=630683 RepID=A0A9Q0ITK8_9TELE|nr:hypothetical protein NHX12_022511 [Muraenolepis orangiensis]
MEAEAAAPLSPVSAPPWRPGERRARKPGSANIFGGVALWQLQKLFRAAGDQEAEQRARLVWGHQGEAALAQALMGLRARGPRRGLRARGRRDGHTGSRWMRAFHHMRIGEESPERHGVTSNLQPWDTGAPPEPGTQTPAEEDSEGSGPQSQGPVLTSETPCLSEAALGPPRAPGGRPERYLHRIIH